MGIMDIFSMSGVLDLVFLLIIFIVIAYIAAAAGKRRTTLSSSSTSPLKLRQIELQDTRIYIRGAMGQIAEKNPATIDINRKRARFEFGMGPGIKAISTIPIKSIASYHIGFSKSWKYIAYAILFFFLFIGFLWVWIYISIIFLFLMIVEFILFALRRYLLIAIESNGGTVLSQTFTSSIQIPVTEALVSQILNIMDNIIIGGEEPAPTVESLTQQTEFKNITTPQEKKNLPFTTQQDYQPQQPQAEMITVTCPYCGFTSQIPANMRGQWVKCPNCGNQFQIP